MTISTIDLVVINQTITLEQQGSRYDTSNITLDLYLAMIAFGSRHRINNVTRQHPTSASNNYIGIAFTNRAATMSHEETHDDTLELRRYSGYKYPEPV